MLVDNVNETTTQQNKNEHINANIMISEKKQKARKLAISKRVTDFDRFGGGGVTHFTDKYTTHISFDRFYTADAATSLHNNTHRQSQ